VNLSSVASLTGFGVIPTIYPTSLMKGATVSLLETVSFQHITRILGVIDDLEISREAVEIPLSPERPGVVRLLANGKLEIVVDAEIPFDDWLQTLPQKIQALMPVDSESDSSTSSKD
jgi:hypothetical protein